MLFQPAILALLLASAASVAMLLGVAPFAVAVLRHWDISSGSERQLALERRTYLMSALLTLVLATQLVCSVAVRVQRRQDGDDVPSPPCARWAR